jgi:hypothetical protein
MQRDGVIESYAIGGAVGATFYLEPVATLDVDIFVGFRPEPGRFIVSPKPIFDYLTQHGATVEGEYLILAGWPVQFLPPTGPLGEEALAAAIETDVEGEPTSRDIVEQALTEGRRRGVIAARELSELGRTAHFPPWFNDLIAAHIQ